AVFLAPRSRHGLPRQEPVLRQREVDSAVGGEPIRVVAPRIRFQEQVPSGAAVTRELDRAKTAIADPLQEAGRDACHLVVPLADAEAGDAVVRLVLPQLPPRAAEDRAARRVHQAGAEMDAAVPAR